MQNILRTLLCLCLFVLSTAGINAQWIKTNGLPGGSVYSFTGLGDTVLASVGKELYLSSNHGQTWSLLPNAFDISFSDTKNDGSQILGRRYNPTTGTRLIRSGDVGVSWIDVQSADTMLFYEAFMAFGYIYGTDYHGLYRSNNDGASWEYMTHQQVSKILFDGQRLTGLTYPEGIVQSNDGGITWQSILQPAGVVVDMLQQDNQLFVILQNGNCHVSLDYGQTWQFKTNTGLDPGSGFFFHNGVIYSIDYEKLYKSSDLGQTWKLLPLPSDELFAIYHGISTGNAILLADGYSNSGNILRSTDDGDSWFEASAGIIAASGKLRTINNKLYAPGTGGVYRLNADGLGWTKESLNFTPSDHGYGLVQDYMQSGDNLVLVEGGSPQVSLDGGVTWFNSFISGIQFSGLGVDEIEAVGDKILGFGSSPDFAQDFISTNHGLTFAPLESFWNQFQSSILSIALDQGSIYALSSEAKIYRSDDGAENWTLYSTTVPVDSFAPFGFFESRLLKNGNIMVVSVADYGKKMAYSKDAGLTWTFVNLATAGKPWGQEPISDLLSIGNYLIAGTKNGVFLSQNNGDDWTSWNDALLQRNVVSFEVYDGYLWINTDGGGIWKRSLAELDIKSTGGKVFFDENANTTQDSGEPNLASVVVQSLTSNTYASTRTDGSYELYSNLPQEQLKVQIPKPYWIATPATQIANVPGANANFALSLNPDAKDLSVELTNVSVLRPGFESNFTLSWRNNVPIAANNVVITLTYPPDLLDLISTVPAPATQSGNTLSWYLGDVAASASGHILLRVKVPVTDAIGTLICVSATITPSDNDLMLSDNTRERCMTVVGSFDPNDKQAEPSDFFSLAQLANNEPLTYTIRFQNTGNFPASFIRIADTLQQNFDPASFQFLSSSHPCTWNLRNQGAVEFFFNNILLPPTSLDEPGSHGFVKYSIQPKQNLPLGTPLRNTAHIYFDYNAPVITNTTETVVGTVKTSNPSVDQTFHLSPNPATNQVLVDTGGDTGELMIQDINGRVVLQKSIAGSRETISVKTLPQGVYQVIFFGKKATQHQQLAVLH